jgi:hypothetical protein
LPGISRIAPYTSLLTMQQIRKHLAVMHVRGRATTE